jgi:hypothetical protein
MPRSGHRRRTGTLRGDSALRRAGEGGRSWLRAD